jgi:hypothetical protein
MAVITGNNALARLVEALGLQQRRVRALTISVRVDEVVKVVAEMYADEEQVDAIADLITASSSAVEIQEVTVPDPDAVDHFMVGTQEKDGIDIAWQGRCTLAEAMSRGQQCAGFFEPMLFSGPALMSSVCIAHWLRDGTLESRPSGSAKWVTSRWRD